MNQNTFAATDAKQSKIALSDIYHLLAIAEEQTANEQVMNADDSINKLRMKYGL